MGHFRDIWVTFALFIAFQPPFWQYPSNGVAGDALTFDEATELAVNWFNSALESDPTDEKLAWEAVGLLDQVRQASPEYVPAPYFQAMMLQRLNADITRIVNTYRAAVKLDPTNADAMNNLGKALSDSTSSDGEEEIWYQRAVLTDPDHIQARLNLAIHKVGKRDFQGSVDELNKLIARGKVNADVLYNRAWAHERLGNLMLAVDDYRAVLSIEPNHVSAWLNLAALHHKHGTVSDAIEHYHHTLSALQASGSEDVSVRVMVLNNLGLAYQQKGLIPNATACHSHAITLLRDNETPESSNWVKDTLTNTLSHLYKARKMACDWERWDERFASLLSMVCSHQVDCSTAARLPAYCSQHGEITATANTALLPFDTLGAPVSPEFRLLIAQKYSSQWASLVSPYTPDRKADPLVVGYLSFDFNDHPTTHLVEGLFAAHRRLHGNGSTDETSGDVRAVAFGYGKDDGSLYRHAIETLSHEFVNLVELDHRSAVAEIRRRGVHIAVDLQGHTLGSRPEITAMRAAPIQVNYLIFPGTSGASWIDYLLCDRHIAPPESASVYTEKLAYMPHSYQVNHYSRHVSQQADLTEEMLTLLRHVRDCGFPVTPFVFVNFNKNDKLEPMVVGLWLDLLARVPNSLLWLLRPSERLATSSIEQNIRSFAASKGIQPQRVIFADRVPKPNHLARHKLGHLFVDTFFYGAHSTATDALVGGLPVISCVGDAFARRVGQSLLSSVGSELVHTVTLTHSLRELSDTAVRIALDHQRKPGRLLAALKAELRKSTKGLGSPLFDTTRFTSDLEEMYRAMWEVNQGTGASWNLFFPQPNRD